MHGKELAGACLLPSRRPIWPRKRGGMRGMAGRATNNIDRLRALMASRRKAARCTTNEAAAGEVLPSPKADGGRGSWPHRSACRVVEVWSEARERWRRGSRQPAWGLAERHVRLTSRYLFFADALVPSFTAPGSRTVIACTSSAAFAYASVGKLAMLHSIDLPRPRLDSCCRSFGPA